MNSWNLTPLEPPNQVSDHSNLLGRLRAEQKTVYQQQQQTTEYTALVRNNEASIHVPEITAEILQPAYQSSPLRSTRVGNILEAMKQDRVKSLLPLVQSGRRDLPPMDIHVIKGPVLDSFIETLHVVTNQSNDDDSNHVCPESPGKATVDAILKKVGKPRTNHENHTRSKNDVDLRIGLLEKTLRGNRGQHKRRRKIS